MTDSIIIKRFWQDIDYFQIAIECKTEFIVVRGEVYTTNDLIDDLYNKLEIFLSGKVDTTYWQNGARGDSTTPCISLVFFPKDKLGHIQIEVFMEINDGGLLSDHNCCFYINTEIGLLQKFKEDLLKLKIPQPGIQIMLNVTGDGTEC